MMISGMRALVPTLFNRNVEADFSFMANLFACFIYTRFKLHSKDEINKDEIDRLISSSFHQKISFARYICSESPV